MYLYNGEPKYIVTLSGKDESYASESDSEEDVEGDLSGLMDIGNTLMTINAFKSTDVDDSYFELPADYSEVSLEEFSNKMFGSLDWDGMLGSAETESDESQETESQV